MFEKYESIQKVPCQIIKNTLKFKRFAHAYLIETNGYEYGFDFALSFAKSIICSDYKDGQADCKQCNLCQMIDENNFSEVKIIDTENNIIKKEELMDLQEEFNKKAIYGYKKIYIINNAWKLNLNSSNAILKFLEEPHEGIIAILVTDNKYQLLNTIVSRCQIISLNNNLNLENKTTFEKIAMLLTNSQKKYEEFIANETKKRSLDNVIEFIKYYEKHKKKVLLHINELLFNNFKDKDQINSMLLLVIYFYKDVLNYKLGLPLEIYNDYIDIIENISFNNSVDNILYKITTISENRLFIENNANLNLLMDKIIIELEEGVK